MEYKVQVSYDDGKTWINSVNSINFEYMKSIVDKWRKVNPNGCKYRIVGREILPWCEIKEDNMEV